MSAPTLLLPSRPNTLSHWLGSSSLGFIANPLSIAMPFSRRLSTAPYGAYTSTSSASGVIPHCSSNSLILSFGYFIVQKIPMVSIMITPTFFRISASSAAIPSAITARVKLFPLPLFPHKNTAWLRVTSIHISLLRLLVSPIFT